jgi:hypothetical protein
VNANKYDKAVAYMVYRPLLDTWIDDAVDVWVDAMDAYLGMLDEADKRVMWDDIMEIVQTANDVALLPDEWLALLYFRDITHSLIHRRKDRGFLTMEEQRRLTREVTLRSVLWKLSSRNSRVDISTEVATLDKAPNH